jgi:hypothetical protein
MGMNTNRTGMRTVLAAAAAGALIMGSAAGAMAVPGHKADPKTGYMQVKMVDVHNGFVNIHPDAAHRLIKAKANVRDTVKTQTPDGLTFTLAQYSKKGDGNKVEAAAAVVSPMTIVLTTKASADKKSKNYNGTLDVYAAIEAIVDPVQKAATKAAIAAAPVLLCLDVVDLDAPDGVTEKPFTKQVNKKIGTDCVRVVNVDPKSTDSHSDDK